jgi:hypothetical protein
MLFAALTHTVNAQTVGNGAVIQPSPGERGAYGINAEPMVGGYSAFPTKHRRIGGSGIGGSTVGTTSPTSESSPAVVVPEMVQDSLRQFHLPKLDSHFGDTSVSPALTQFTPALPAQPRTRALTNPLSDTSYDAAIRRSPLVEDLPSFSKQPSFVKQMQFDQFSQ